LLQAHKFARWLKFSDFTYISSVVLFMLMTMNYKYYEIFDVRGSVHHSIIHIEIFDVRGSVHHSIIHTENSTRCNSVSKFYFIFIWSSACFGQHATNHQEPKTALAASGFTYMEGCWTCSCWTLSASSNYMSNNLPRM